MNSQQIEGRNAVMEAFRSGKPIDKVYILDGCQDGPIRSIVREAKKHDTILNFVTKERHITGFFYQTSNTFAFVSDHQTNRSFQIHAVHHIPIHICTDEPESLFFQFFHGFHQIGDFCYRCVIQRTC